MAERIRCTACGAEQDADLVSMRGTCFVCGAPVGGPAPTEAAENVAAGPGVGRRSEGDLEGDLFDVDDVSGRPPSRRLLDDLPLEAPESVSPEIEEIRAGERRLSRVLVLVGLGLVAAVGVAIWRSAQPDRPPPPPKGSLEEARVRLDELADLVRQYRREVGNLPDEETWERSASGSARFQDPWGRVVLYERRQAGFVLGTYGRDGEPGGAGLNEDLFLVFPENAGEGAVDAGPRAEDEDQVGTGENAENGGESAAEAGETP